MKKIYTAIGLMSGTSMDGVDLSIIKSDGKNEYKVIDNKYFEYNKDLYQNLISLRGKISRSKDLQEYNEKIKHFEREITLFHARIIKNLLTELKIKIDFIGFHGQTIFHNADEGISRQLGDGELLSQLTQTKVIYNFRKNDLKNGGQGAPLTPIFHSLIEGHFNLKPVIFANIGGVVNVTTICDKGKLAATDIGPGMCLIDEWIKKKKKKKYDINGSIASKGKIDSVLNFALENFFYKEEYNDNKLYIKSFDTKDFDISFVRGLSIEDGAATLCEFTAKIIARYFFYINDKLNKNSKNISPIFLCGGGRKNNFLIERIKKNGVTIKFIDDFKIDGDFVESQAFAYLAIRSFLGFPISFPETTGVKTPCTGGILTKNF